MQTLPGFRDVYPEEQALRSLILEGWTDVARRFGFVEVATPTLEPLELYQKKSGDELIGQLFAFEDKGERAVALRPELTPSVARMVVNKNRELRKPVRWFSNGMFFRFERPQKGRLREFGQFNCDLYGVPGPGADAEMIHLLIELLRSTGLSEAEFAVRISDRGVWSDFARREAISEEKVPTLLQVIDKLGREKEERSVEALEGIGVSLERVKTFMAEPVEEGGQLSAVLQDLRSRGVGEYVVADKGVVRGLAYYSGVVFEAFDRGASLRAIAGGGRYDQLLCRMSDGAVDLPAVGFAIGDVVIMELLKSDNVQWRRLVKTASGLTAPEVVLICADESKREKMLALATEMRRRGRRVTFALGSEKVGKQFQAGEASGAQCAVVCGQEWPEVKVKELALRTEETVKLENLFSHLEKLLDTSSNAG